MQAPREKLIFKMVQAKVEAIQMIDIVQVLVMKKDEKRRSQMANIYINNIN